MGCWRASESSGGEWWWRVRRVGARRSRFQVGISLQTSFLYPFVAGLSIDLGLAETARPVTSKGPADGPRHRQHSVAPLHRLARPGRRCVDPEYGETGSGYREMQACSERPGAWGCQEGLDGAIGATCFPHVQRAGPPDIAVQGRRSINSGRDQRGQKASLGC